MLNMAEVVAALVWDKDKFMICQRPASKARGLLWEFVGGKVEPGETKEQALVRECREELAITVAPTGIFTEVDHVYPDITIHLTLFNCTIAEGVPQLLAHNDLCWITTDEISQYEFCPADNAILDKLKYVKKYNKLVRDYIPKIIEDSGKTCVTEVLSDEAYIKMLDAKLDEELAEYHKDQNIEELADLMEVIYACAAVHGYSVDDIENIRREKAAKCGRFKKKILLKEVVKK